MKRTAECSFSDHGAGNCCWQFFRRGERAEEKGPVEGVIVKVIPLNETGGDEKAENGVCIRARAMSGKSYEAPGGRERVSLQSERSLREQTRRPC